MRDNNVYPESESECTTHTLAQMQMNSLLSCFTFGVGMGGNNPDSLYSLIVLKQSSVIGFIRGKSEAGTTTLACFVIKYGHCYSTCFVFVCVQLLSWLKLPFCHSNVLILFKIPHTEPCIPTCF